uniref:Uncharacterized protein n=1 Tax=Arundo donax TaxID=35708 RepID=A0A0A9GCK4_ARUDO
MHPKFPRPNYGPKRLVASPQQTHQNVP